MSADNVHRKNKLTTIVTVNVLKTSFFDFIYVQQTVDPWGISKRRIQKLCEENRIIGYVRFGRAWAILKGYKETCGRLFDKAIQY